MAYATSFWTIGGLWGAHHAVFLRLRRADPKVLHLNLLLLMVVAFLPFPTGLMAEALREPGAEETAVLFYGATLLVITSVMAALARYAGARRDLLVDGVTRADLVAAVGPAEPSLGFYAIVLALAFLAPQVAAVGFLVIAVAAVLVPGAVAARAARRRAVPIDAGTLACERGSRLRRSLVGHARVDLILRNAPCAG